MSQPCWISLREPVVSSSTCSLRVLPRTISNSTADSDDAKDESANVDAVSEYVVGRILCQVGKGSDKRSAIRKGYLETRRRCTDKVRSRIVGQPAHDLPESVPNSER